MVFKINHLGKVKSSLVLDPELLTEAKSQAAKTHLTLGNVVEQALTDYLQKVRLAEEEKERKCKEEEQREREEEVKRYEETGRRLPPTSVFLHHLSK